jgi:hypothetical protein
MSFISQLVVIAITASVWLSINKLKHGGIHWVPLKNHQKNTPIKVLFG